LAQFTRATIRLFCACVIALATAFAHSKAQIRLAVWEGDEALTVLRKAVGEFEKANPGIKVKMENVDYRYFFQRLLAQVAANTAPDVTMLDPQNYQKYARRDALLDLEPLVKATPGFNLDGYYPEIVDVFRWQSGLYVMPRDIAPIGLIYYNKRLFKEAGLELPDGNWTWDFKPRPELGSQCFTYCMQKLTQKNAAGKVQQWGFAPSWTGAFTDTLQPPSISSISPIRGS
jgi:multiple sugar transport system substrate-binding protein